ncbi:hypothetical protein HA402_012958 [Bradysia odoriphaga]|nr:hypothetical protein HA402_012958 [Bradysia odoriphaga]
MTQFMDEEDDESKVLQPHRASINQSAKQKINNNIEVSEKSLGLGAKSILTQILMCVLINTSVLSTGMGLGFPAVTIYSLTNQTSTMALTETEISWFASIPALLCPVGGFICSCTLDKFGRKRTLYLVNLIAITSWLILTFASTTDKDVMFAQIMAARVIIGISTGFSTGPSSVYTAEIAHPKIRGRLVVLGSCSIATGIMLIYMLGYFIPTNWRLISGIACGISVAATILLSFIPESPNWLASKGRIDEAEKSLRLFKGLPRVGSFTNPELSNEITHLQHQSRTRNEQNETVMDKLTRPEVYKPLGIMIGFFAFQQFCGIFIVIVYAVSFSQAAGVNLDPFLCAVLIGAARLVASFGIMFVLDSVGRRIPTMLSGVSMAVCMFSLMIYTKYYADTLTWIPVTLIILFVLCSTIGLLTIPFTLLGEMYPANARGLASGITLSVAFTLTFIVIKLYPSFIDAFGHNNLFLFFGVMSLLSIVYVYFLVPETKGKTLKEIGELFRKKSIVDVKDGYLSVDIEN